MTDLASRDTPHALGTVHAIGGLGVAEMMIVAIVLGLLLAVLLGVVGVVLWVARRR